MKALLFLITFVSLTAYGQDTIVVDKVFILQVEDVVNTREINGSHITDSAKLLSDSSSAYIDSLLIATEDSLGYQVAIVNLDSIGDQTVRDFGVELFNYWGIGEEVLDNGLLIITVMDVRRTEFITGYGTEHVLTDLQSYKIQQHEMVPRFKIDAYDLGLVEGVKATVKVLNGQLPDYLYTEESSTQDVQSDTNPEKKPQGIWNFLITDGFIILFIITISVLAASIPAVIFIVLLLIALFSKNLTAHQRFKKIWFGDSIIVALLFPIPFLLFYVIVRILKRKWRHAAEGKRSEIQVSERTAEAMKLLSFEEQNIVLAKGLVSVNDVNSELIDIWSTADYSEVKLRKFELRWSMWRNAPRDGKLYYTHTQCKSCKYKKNKLQSSEVISKNSKITKTQYAYKCLNCGELTTNIRQSKTYKPSKSSNLSSKSSNSKSYSYTSSRSSSSKSSSSKSSNSSSSSKGSSYGGGKSGSGGSGSSW